MTSNFWVRASISAAFGAVFSVVYMFILYPLWLEGAHMSSLIFRVTEYLFEIMPVVAPIGALYGFVLFSLVYKKLRTIPTRELIGVFSLSCFLLPTASYLIFVFPLFISGSYEMWLMLALGWIFFGPIIGFFLGYRYLQRRVKEDD